MNVNSPIGIFDSGMGGISVLKQIHALMPQENLLYFGDSAYAPYGEKSRAEITCLLYTSQGHNLGEINAGANGNGVVEAEVTYRVGKYLAKYLNTDPAFTARVSRLFLDTVLGYDAASSLQERVAMANRWPADYFITVSYTHLSVLLYVAAAVAAVWIFSVFIWRKNPNGFLSEN